MQKTSTAASLAQAIVAQHRTTFAGHPAQPMPPASSTAAVYQAALQACSTLGFIAADAQCLAQAWQRRAERTGNVHNTDWPDHPSDFGLDSAPSTPAFAPCPRALGLYAVLPDAVWVGRMAQAGVPTVQLRLKSTDTGAIAAEVRAAVQAVTNTSARLFINDHWREAIAAQAYGVHLGQEDLDALHPNDLAAIRDAGLRLGVSTHGYAEMLRADAVGPSYIALGAVFPTTLKRMATAPQGLGRLAAYARLMAHRPLVAIGGIDAAQFAPVLATGVGSIAVVRALVNAENPETQASQLIETMRIA